MMKRVYLWCSRSGSEAEMFVVRSTSSSNVQNFDFQQTRRTVAEFNEERFPLDGDVTGTGSG